jgi:hypothetical protein
MAMSRIAVAKAASHFAPGGPPGPDQALETTPQQLRPSRCEKQMAGQPSAGEGRQATEVLPRQSGSDGASLDDPSRISS